MDIFGFEITKKSNNKKHVIDSPIVPENGVNVSSMYGYMETGFVHSRYNRKNDLAEKRARINQRWALYENAEVKYAVDEIVNEMVDFSIKSPIEINFEEESSISKQQKTKITEALNDLYPLIGNNLNRFLKNWYVQGAFAWFIQLDKAGKKIVDLKVVEPHLLEWVQPTEVKTNEQGVTIFDELEPYWLYTQEAKDGTSSTQKQIKLHKDSIVWIDSGISDKTTIQSYIDYAIKPMNDLLSLENSSVIYRLTRAPEKRAFYVDTGQLAPAKAEEYVKQLMARFKTKIDYNSKTGEVTTTNKNIIGATVDYWMPRREGSTGTEIDVINETSSSMSNIIDEINYFKKKLYQSLFIPTSRVEDQPGFSLGQSGSITREEVKFSQLISKLESEFNNAFYQLLRVQLDLDNSIPNDEWDEIVGDISINFISNDFFAESKRHEMISERLNILRDAKEYEGTYLSRDWIRRNILDMTDNEIKAMNEQIQKEIKDGELNDPNSEESESRW